MKKILSTCLTMIFVLALSMTAYAATTYTEGTLYYTVNDESITITGCFGKDATVEVPASIAGTPVNTIGKNAFSSNENITTVILPDTITAIEEGAFSAGITVQQRKTTGSDQNENNPSSSDTSDDATSSESTGSANSTNTELITLQTGNSEATTDGGMADEAEVGLDDLSNNRSLDANDAALNNLSPTASIVVITIGTAASILLLLFIIKRIKK